MKSIKNYRYPSFGSNRVEYDFDGRLDIETINVYSHELYVTIEPLEKENKELESSYKKVLSEYKSEKEKQDELSDRILNRVWEVRNEYADMDKIWSLYKNEYLPLAGDESIAMAFLKKAYTVNSKTEHYIEDKMKIHRNKK